LYWKVKTKTSIPKISDIRSLLWHQIIKIDQDENKTNFK